MSNNRSYSILNKQQYSNRANEFTDGRYNGEGEGMGMGKKMTWGQLATWILIFTILVVVSVDLAFTVPHTNSATTTSAVARVEHLDAMEKISEQTKYVSALKDRIEYQTLLQNKKLSVIADGIDGISLQAKGITNPQKTCPLFPDISLEEDADPTLWRTHQVKNIDGFFMHVRETGKINQTDAPTILFLHGLGQGLYTWIHQLNSDFLRSKFRMVAVDLPGHGLSERPTSLSSFTNTTIIGNIINVIIEQLNLTDPILVGHSRAGHNEIAQYLNIFGDGDVGGYVSVDTQPRVGPPPHSKPGCCEFFGFLLNNPINGIPSMAQILRGLEEFADELTECKDRSKTIQQIMTFNAFSWIRFALDTNGTFVLSHFFVGADPPLLNGTDIWGAFTKPVLLLSGDLDNIVRHIISIPRYLSDFTSTTPEVEIWRRIGHSLMWEDPLRFEEKLCNFISGALGLGFSTTNCDPKRFKS